MMRFPQIEQLGIDCRMSQYVPGRLHSDGRRYLPLIVLDLPPVGMLVGGLSQLIVVDRHHVVDASLEGRFGRARLVFLLSRIMLQTLPLRQGLVGEAGLPEGRSSSAPIAYGQVVGVPTWELQQQHLPYQALFGELLLDIGVGVVGVRTSMTADSLAASIGSTQVGPGDWLQVLRSRIDILQFVATEEP